MRRYLPIVVGLLLLVGLLAALKFAQIRTLVGAGRAMEKLGPPPEAVGSAVAQAQAWERTLSAVGSVTSARSVELSNDAPGIVERIHFRSGEFAEQDRILVELEAGPERSQLASARARRDLAQVTVKRSRVLVAERVIARAQLDADEAELRAARAEVAALQAQLERKIVRAPFPGRLGIRAVTVGQYLEPGTTVTVLDGLDGALVDFTLPQQDAGEVRVGTPVRVDGRDGATEGGAIVAAGPTVEATTRNVKLRARLENGGGVLPSGTFVNVAVVLPERAEVVVVPATAIVHASYGDSVFVLEPKKPGSPGMDRTPDGKPVLVARQQFVRLGRARGDFVAVVEGLAPGQEVVTEGAFKLRNGAPVVVDNTVKTEPRLDPRPENR